MGLPDTEAIVGEFLRSVVTVPVSGLVPNPRPGRFVRVWRTGGPAMSRVVDQPQLTVQAWDESSSAAAWELMSACREALLGAARLDAMPLVRRVYMVGGPYYDPDPESGAHRYSMTVAFRIRATRN